MPTWANHFRIADKLLPHLKTLDTERVILPKNIVCNKKHEFKGYTTFPYVDLKRNIYDISGEEFLREVNLVNQELVYLGEHFVSVDDLPNISDQVTEEE